MTQAAEERQTYRKQLDLPIEEVEQDDWMRDRGRFRTVAFVEPRLLEQAIYIYFEDGLDPSATSSGDPLPVKIPTTVSLWRVCDGP